MFLKKPENIYAEPAIKDIPMSDFLQKARESVKDNKSLDNEITQDSEIKQDPQEIIISGNLTELDKISDTQETIDNPTILGVTIEPEKLGENKKWYDRPEGWNKKIQDIPKSHKLDQNGKIKETAGTKGSVNLKKIFIGLLLLVLIFLCLIKGGIIS